MAMLVSGRVTYGFCCHPMDFCYFLGAKVGELAAFFINPAVFFRELNTGARNEGISWVVRLPSNSGK